MPARPLTTLNSNPYYGLPEPSDEKLSDAERAKLLDGILAKKVAAGGKVEHNAQQHWGTNWGTAASGLRKPGAVLGRNSR